MSELEYTQELEKMVIWLCDIYTQTQDNLACHEKNGQTDDAWMNIFMTVPTIQGTQNRMMVEKIGSLRSIRGNREGWNMTLDELYEKLSVGRTAYSPKQRVPATPLSKQER